MKLNDSSINLHSNLINANNLLNISLSSNSENSLSSEENSLKPFLLAQNFKNNKLLFKNLNPGVSNFAMKCISGAYKHKYLYISCAPDGEIVGSGNPHKASDNYVQDKEEEK